MVASFSRPTIGLGYRIAQLWAIITFGGLLYCAICLPRPIGQLDPIACYRLSMSFFGLPPFVFAGAVYMAYTDENEIAPKWASYITFISFAWFAVWLISMFVNLFTN